MRDVHGSSRAVEFAQGAAVVAGCLVRCRSMLFHPVGDRKAVVCICEDLVALEVARGLVNSRIDILGRTFEGSRGPELGHLCTCPRVVVDKTMAVV